MSIPFADFLGLVLDEMSDGRSRYLMSMAPEHLNSAGAMHGGVTFSLTDTGMGAALRSAPAPDEVCATIETKISYFRPIFGGTLVCDSKVLLKGKSIASLEAMLTVDGQLVAAASGTFAIRRKKQPA